MGFRADATYECTCQIRSPLHVPELIGYPKIGAVPGYAHTMGGRTGSAVRKSVGEFL